MKAELAEEVKIPGNQSKSDVRDDQVKRFRSLAKEYFELDLGNRFEPLQRIKEISGLGAFPLPVNLNEIFIRAEESYLLWILDTPLNKRLEDFFNTYFSKTTVYDYFKTAREFYQKWVLSKSASEKKYYAHSFINLAEKNFKNNFLFLLHLSSVFSNERSFLNYQKALESLEKGKEGLFTNKMCDSFNNELLYHINLMAGFIHLKENNLTSANEKFSDAIRINPFGITSKFYLALSEMRMKRVETAYHLLKEILGFDIFRCEFAVDSYNSKMLQYFINNPVIKNIFYYDDFASVAHSFEDELLDIKTVYSDGLNQLKKKIIKLDELKFVEFYNDESIKILSFIGQAISILGESKSMLFYRMLPVINMKFNIAVNIFKQMIKEKYYSEAKVKLTIYDKLIEEKVKETDRLKTDQGEYFQKMKARFKEGLDRIEKESVERISEIESRINSIYDVKSLSPANSFGTSMTYNLIFSILVFMMGGCAGYSDSLMTNAGDMKEIMGAVFLAGLKWGGITFSSGVFISFIVAGYAVMERSTQKQRYLKQISFIKEQKETQIQFMTKENTSSEKSANNNYSRRIESNNEAVKKIAEDKLQQEKIYYKEADVLINEEVKKLEGLA